ncbi:MAG TPA: GAF domain-containing sensor histidine kinase [Thermomicrobiales bacterium]|nr:GAF domain-containing sensor histidine kinase [Thermomicrobiales bacterium]
MTRPARSARDTPWRLLLPKTALGAGRLRWPLGGAIAVAFALGQVLEAAAFGDAPGRLPFDILAWGALGGAAVWLSLTWVARQERRHEAGLAHALREQRALNRRLRRANDHLALLSDVNRRIADSASLDAILDAALDFPPRLVPVRAAALLLDDAGGAVTARAVGAPAEELARRRAARGLDAAARDLRGPRVVEDRRAAGACVLLPLLDGRAPLGRIELYLAPGAPVADDELALLGTIAGELGEALGGARRRAREARALYALERALAEERARIARDIHDGLAQTLAFRRMRVDLWRDWIADDPDRLRAELGAFKEALREEIRELRRAIFALRPVQFDELGFLGGLERYVAEFAGQQGWEAEVELAGAPATLTPALEAAAFRVVQEALTNSAKHAGASRVWVTLDAVDGGVRVAVRDDGRGFDPGPVADGGGDRLGLRQMRERLAALGGQLTILARPGVGAEVRAWLPLAAGAGTGRVDDGDDAAAGR